MAQGVCDLKRQMQLHKVVTESCLYSSNERIIPSLARPVLSVFTFSVSFLISVKDS